MELAHKYTHAANFIKMDQEIKKKFEVRCSLFSAKNGGWL